MCWKASQHVLSLSFEPADRQGRRCMQLLSDALTLDGGLDWTRLDWALPRLLNPPRARGFYSLAYMLQGR